MLFLSFEIPQATNLMQNYTNGGLKMRISKKNSTLVQRHSCLDN